MELEDYASTPESSAPCTPTKRKHDELEDLNEANADDPGSADPAREPRLYHFKAAYDQLWDLPDDMQEILPTGQAVPCGEGAPCY